MGWDAAAYAAFGSERARPAIDLLARLPSSCAPRHIVDLGCGSGALTCLLATRWPAARIEGVDSSAEMLAAAPPLGPHVDWRIGDIADWQPGSPPDLLASNAALHWLDDHATLFPRLAATLAPGGWLAVQMPHNHRAPSHRAIAAAAADGPWSIRLTPLLRPDPVADLDRYHDWLAPLCPTLDVWETEYLHRLRGPDPVVAWTSGTVLRPLLAVLDEPERAGFLAAYRARIARAYRARADGTTLLPFRRVFIVARKD